MATIVDDRTMQFPVGSLVLSVEGVRFRVPKALVQLNTNITFTVTNDVRSGSDKEVRELDVSLQAFDDWLAVFRTPHHSFLIPSHPSRNDRSRLLELLLLCRKLKTTELEEEVILPLVGHASFAEFLADNLKNGLSAYRIGELAYSLNDLQIAATVRVNILEDVWSNHPGNLLESLSYGTRVGDTMVIGAAYYQLLLLHPPPWSSNDPVVGPYHLDLQRGLMKCIEQWQAVFDFMGTLSPFSQSKVAKSHKSTKNTDFWRDGAWKALADRSLPVYDVIGKIKVVIEYLESIDGDASPLKAKLETIKENMYTWFVPGYSGPQPKVASLPKAVDAKPDDSMLLPSGSIVFLVENVRFRIPEALLRLNSQGFSNMLDNRKSREQPIKLPDSLETFRAWVAVLLTPIQSCMNPMNPMLRNLEKVLNLLLFCQEYNISALKAYLMPVASHLASPERLRANLTAEFTAFKVIAIANKLEQSKISLDAQNIILEDIWSGKVSDMYEVLVSGDSVGAENIVGAAYYQLMLTEWMQEKRLSTEQRRRLLLGRTVCASAWDTIFIAWGKEAEEPDETKCGHAYYWLHGIWRNIAEEGIEAHDVVGRLGVALQYARTFCSSERVKRIQQKMDTFKADLHTCFLAAQAPVEKAGADNKVNSVHVKKDSWSSSASTFLGEALTP